MERRGTVRRARSHDICFEHLHDFTVEPRLTDWADLSLQDYPEVLPLGAADVSVRRSLTAESLDD